MIRNIFLGERDFFSKEEIEGFINKSKNFSLIENDSNRNALLIFDTSKQRTWLVASQARLYCILDDIRKEKPTITWSMSKEEVVDKGNLILNLEAKKKPNKNYTGLLDFGPKHKNWLFSTKLFENSTSEALNRVSSFLVDSLE